jgi:hypothetical protein
MSSKNIEIWLTNANKKPYGWRIAPLVGWLSSGLIYNALFYKQSVGLHSYRLDQLSMSTPLLST